MRVFNSEDSDVGQVANVIAETRDLAFSESEVGVFDDAEEMDNGEVEQISYDITSYGADFAADMLVARLRSSDIVIPSFQREFVWTLRDASRFIESLLLGLPVPGVFFSKDKANRLIVVDGQQRLRSLFAYFENDFKGKFFALTRVHPMLEGKIYKKLEPEQRRVLDNALIHATIFTQNMPKDDESATYSIFERLNNGGRRLYPQEIRAAIHHSGNFSGILKTLNGNLAWRSIYGESKSERMKDVELILRFIALFERSELYEKPMKAFLNDFMAAMAKVDVAKIAAFTAIFDSSISFVENALGPKAFKPLAAFNAAVFDAVMVGVARRLQDNKSPSRERFLEAYNSLLGSEKFKAAYSRATSDKESVQARIQLATDAFAAV